MLKRFWIGGLDEEQKGFGFEPWPRVKVGEERDRFKEGRGISGEDKEDWTMEKTVTGSWRECWGVSVIITSEPIGAVGTMVVGGGVNCGKVGMHGKSVFEEEGRRSMGSLVFFL